MSCAVKVCGVTTIEDAIMVSEAGADYLGVLVNVPSSPRSLTVAEAEEIFFFTKIPTILLTFDLLSEQVINLAKGLKPFGVQLAGNETEEEVEILRKALTCEIWKTLHISTAEDKKSRANDIVDKINNFTKAGVDRIVLDSAVIKGNGMQKGGTGCPFDWCLARAIKAQVGTFLFLAGGIKPDNVKDAILQVNPNGVDLSSGVEKTPGKKNPDLVKRLITTVKNARVSF
jgi:phosphoribosylanthranilate isomerase